MMFSVLSVGILFAAIVAKLGNVSIVFTQIKDNLAHVAYFIVNYPYYIHS
jgi:hypothetical protein